MAFDLSPPIISRPFVDGVAYINNITINMSVALGMLIVNY